MFVASMTHPPEVFCEKLYIFKKFTNLTGKHLYWSFFLKLIKKTSRHKCFPVKLVNFLIIPILKNIPRGHFCKTLTIIINIETTKRSVD